MDIPLSDLPPEKYWITELNISSVKSPYEIKFTLCQEPANIKEILEWCNQSLGKYGYLYKSYGTDYYVEFFFKKKEDLTMFLIKWDEILFNE
jgi:hypothetical protein